MRLFLFAVGVTLTLAASAAPDPLSIVFYNVENLFDNVHAEDHGDWEFVPMDTPGKKEACDENPNPKYKKICHEADWTPPRLEVKLKQIHRVLASVGNSLPALVGVTELENAEVLERLARETGYTGFAATDSKDDYRGLDVGLLFRESDDLKWVKSTEHKIDFAEAKKLFYREGAAWEARNILEVQFLALGDQPVSVFVSHWPSQYYPTDYRIWYAKRLRSLIQERLKENGRTTIVAGGDFNTSQTEQPDSATFVLNDWLTELLPDQGKKSPPGSYFYPNGMTWSRLDRVFVRLGNGTPLDFDRKLTIHVPAFATTSYMYPPETYLAGSVVKRVPWAYNFHADTAESAGFSDHFPVVLRLFRPEKGK